MTSQQVKTTVRFINAIGYNISLNQQSDLKWVGRVFWSRVRQDDWTFFFTPPQECGDECIFDLVCQIQLHVPPDPYKKFNPAYRRYLPKPAEEKITSLDL